MKRSSEHRHDAEEIEEVAVGHHGRQTGARRSGLKPPGRRAVARELRDGRRLPAELREVGERNAVAIAERRNAVDLHQLAGLGERQRPQQHAADDAEDGGGRADAKREHEDDGQCESGCAEERAETEPQILQQLLEPPPAPRVLAFFAQPQRVAELQARGSMRFFA